MCFLVLITLSFLLPHSDQHFVSGSIPVPGKSQPGVSAASEMGYPCHTSSPERGPRKRASSETDKLKYKGGPVPSYNNTAEQQQPTPPPGPGGPTQASPKPLSSSLETEAPLRTLSETLEVKEQGETEEAREEGEGEGEEAAAAAAAAAVAAAAVVEVMTEQQGSSERRVQGDDETMEEGREMEEPGTTTTTTTSSTVHTEPTAVRHGPEAHATRRSAGAMNGGPADPSGPSDLRCSVEEAEEIMGTEATGLAVGLRLGLGQTGGGGARPDEYPCIPVDRAVAVESDEQVLEELDAAGFEEFSRRIYALSENMPSFRRPRKNSDK